MAKISSATVRADFNDPVAVVHYARAAHFLGLWKSETVLIQRFFPDREVRLIEAGCGAGRVTIGLSELGFARIVAFDFAEELLDQARALAVDRGQPGIQFLNADATRLSESLVESASFDGALFMFNGLMQIPGRENRRTALREIAHACRTDAPLLFTTHDRDASPRERSLWRAEAKRWETGQQDERLVEFGDRYFEDAHGRTFMHLPDRDEILADLSATGWTHEYDQLRSEIGREPPAVEAFSDECRFWVARKARLAPRKKSLACARSVGRSPSDLDMVLPNLPEILNQRQLTAAELTNPSSETLLKLYAWMHLARTADNRILDLFRQGLIKGTVTGGQGNEGLIIPLALLADKAIDVVSWTHRDFGGHLIWSDHLCNHLNQYCANALSPTHAREGNIHHGDPHNHSLPMISHLGAMLSTVMGSADSQRRFGRPSVGIALFGDGGSSTGDVHETLNLAALISAPMLFIIENNEYAYSTPTSEQYVGVELFQRAASYGIEGIVIDATDVIGSAQALAEAINKVRQTSRPILIEAKTLRLRGHAAYDTCDYLRPGESERFFARDPVPRFRQSLLDRRLDSSIEKIEEQINHFIETCVQLSLAVPRPTGAGMEADLFAPASPGFSWVPSINSNVADAKDETPEHLTFAQALNRALRKILQERPESLLLGQDIANYGGAFKVTEGLLKDYGRSRVFNTPLAESATTGYAIGLALNGHRPIEEFQFADFSTEAVTQITQNAATFHFRAGAAVPLVLRLPCGAITLGSFHSQELESFFLAMPGLKALYPSTPQDAFNAMLAAYEDNNPVLLFEHKGLYRRGKHPVSWDPEYRKIWEPKLLRTGNFATFVTYGEMVNVAGEVCDYLENEYERSCDLFDLRCLSPLKLDTIRASIGRTHRLIVLHEGRRTHGFGAELVAQLTEELFFSLEAPPLRIGSMDIPVPFAQELETIFKPTRDKIIEQIANWIG